MDIVPLTPAYPHRCQFGGVQPVGGKWKTLSEKELAKYFEAEIQVRKKGYTVAVYQHSLMGYAGLALCYEMIAHRSC